MKKTLELVLQLSIIVICLIVVGDKWSSSKLSAQTTSCNNQPPIHTNDGPQPYFWLKANAWLRGTSTANKRQITVVIHDTTDTVHFNQMNDGIRTWNDYSDCAYVNFNQAAQATNPTGEPPVDTL